MKIFSFILGACLLVGCAVVDYTNKSTINRGCLQLKIPTTLYEKNCPACRVSFAIKNAADYAVWGDKSASILDGSSRRAVKNLPVGTRITVDKPKKAVGLYDGYPYYISGHFLQGELNIEIDIP